MAVPCSNRECHFSTHSCHSTSLDNAAPELLRSAVGESVDLKCELAARGFQPRTGPELSIIPRFTEAHRLVKYNWWSVS